MATPKGFELWPRPDRRQASRDDRDAEFESYAEFVQSLADGEPGPMRRLAARARKASGAVFVAIARCAAGGRGVSFVAVEGPPGTEAALGNENFVPIWRAALEGRRTISGDVPFGREASSGTADASLRLRRQGIESVLAIPLEARGAPVGLLVAGLAADAPDAATRERLELHAPLAALALAEEQYAERTRVNDQWLAALLDSMENAVLLVEPGGRVRLANARLPELLGVAPERMGRIKTFDELLAAVRGNFRDPRGAEARWREIQRRDDEVAWDEVELERPAPRVLERFARPVRNAEGERLGWLELYRETSSESRPGARKPQSEKMAALGQLVSGIAHELNNPLTSIVGYAQRLLGRAAGDAELQHIFDEAQRAGAIVRNLLLFAREAKPERKRVRLNEIVKQTVALRDYVLRVENVSLTLDLEPGLPPVLADPHQLQQLVLNLLINAEQAVENGPGRGEIEVRTSSVERRGVRLEVRDDGGGIPPEVLPRIFDPFFTTKLAGAGTGLGLSIVSAIAQEHGGEVRVESEPGRGATFIVELPSAPASLEEDVEPAAATTAVIRPRPEAAPGARRRILVVEDEPTVASLVADVLREEGHDVETILDSVEALERLNREDFDLLICDLKMPKLDGRALYEDALRRGRTSRDRVLFITGDTLRPRTLDFVRRNSLPYLAKPFLVDELTQTVRNVLGGRHDAANLPAPVTRVPAVGE
ncbi:MAG TPA: ATP-binding protein [Candidatus Acidoferrales bacterium]|nr:ATP-binding protein [Candidatus Acidoferrales bacterium]